jgi:hypothetical protein
MGVIPINNKNKDLTAMNTAINPLTIDARRIK